MSAVYTHNKGRQLYMAVIRKTFTGNLSGTPTGVAYTITGLTSESSTTNVTGTVIEATLHFLDSLYQTLIEAGYNDTVKNENDYSITILGFKVFVICIVSSNRIYPKIYTCGNKSGVLPNSTTSASSSLAINNNTSPYTNLSYNVLVRGDSNHVSIYLGSFQNPNADYVLYSIAKGKDLITSSDIYMYASKINGTQYICKKDDLYTLIVNGSSVYNATPSVSGLNTNSKFVCVPQLIHNNTILIPSMIQGNSAIFETGKYYKIGSEIYYNENGYLYKVG